MAFSIHNLKIRQQILLVTLPPIFVLLCSVALLIYSYWLALHTSRSNARSLESVVEGEDVLRTVAEIHLGVRGYLLYRDRAMLSSYNELSDRLLSGVARLRELEGDDPEQLKVVDEIQTAVNRWKTEWVNPTIRDVDRGATLDLPRIKDEGVRRFSAVRKPLLALIEANRAENEAAMRASTQLMKRMLMMALVVAALVALIVLLVTREVAGLLEQPVRQLIDASERVGRGDFKLALPPPTDNEFGVLWQSFAHMTAALRQEREELAALNRFSEVVTQCTSEGEIYEHVLYSLRDRFHPRQVIIFKLNSEENFLEAAATLVPLPKELQDWPVIPEPHNCKAVRMGRRFRVNDVMAEPLCPAKFVPPSEGSYYCGPLIAGGVIIGAVRVEGPKGLWTPERESLLESYLSGAATALSNLRLLESTKEQANVDELTGLYNRRFLEEYARKLIAMARRKEQPLGVIMMDLDHFKECNDVYGHEAGDRILRHFARTATRAIREANLAARYGGEEFVVMLPDTGAQSCLIVAERIRQAVERMVIPSGGEKPLPQVTVSLGIAIYPDHGHSLEEIFQAADKALYESKRAGRNRTTLYSPPPEEPAA
jgi:diguanylate cyclase (GGDEF)-like protein